MPTTARSRSYPRSLLRYQGIRLTTAADLAANPIVDPLADPRVHTTAQILDAFDYADGRTLILWHGERLCMREIFPVPGDAAYIGWGNAAIVGVFDPDQSEIGIRVAESTESFGIDPVHGPEPRYCRLRFIRYAQSDWSDPAGDIGIQIWNAYNAHIDIVGSRGSACSLEIATDDRTGYSQFGVGHLHNGQTALRLKNYALTRPDAGAVFTNRNIFRASHGGRLSVDSNVNTTQTRYGIHFTRDQAGDAATMDRNEFHGLTLEMGVGVTGGAESVCFLHDIGVENSLLDYYDESNSLIYRWNGDTRGHRYISGRNDRRRQQGEYLGTYAGAGVRPRERPLAAEGGSFWESADLSQPGNHVIAQKTNPSDSLWLRDFAQIRSSAGTLAAVEDAGSANYTLTNGYVKTADTSRGFGVLLDTRHGKEFYIDRDTDPTYLSGGRILIRCFDTAGVVIGGRSPVTGSFTAVADNSGFAQFTHAAHAVQVDDVLEITGASVAEYNRDQVASAVTSLAVSGGQMVLTTPAAHKLAPGDWVRVYGTSSAAHTGFHRVFSAPTATTAVLDSDITGSSTGGYFTAKRYHRVTAADANTFTTHRAYAGDASGSYATILLFRQENGSSGFAATSSWGRGYQWNGDGLGEKVIRFHQFVDYALIGVIRSALRRLRIGSLDGFPVNVRPGHNYHPGQPLGYSPPSVGAWGLGARIFKFNRASGTGVKDIGWSCGTAGTPGTWQIIQETLA